MLRRLVGENIKLAAVLDPALGKVKADHGQLEQVIINLVVNARDAMPHGGRLVIETKNAVLDEFSTDHFHDVQPGHYTVLSVSDSGVGMDAETQLHIFEPFFTTKEVGKGTGLGLATVYGIVKQSGGDVGVRSAPGEGATFRIYLPRVDGIVETARPETPSKMSTEGSETVLLVEDEESIRNLVSELLGKNGYKVLAAKNGNEALETGRRHSGPVHLLLTDVMMAGMSGPELAKQLSAFRPEARVLYMSGYADRSFSQHSTDLSDTLFLQKPFTRDGLMRKVRQCLDLPEVKTTA
jgi:CheY-like chemotaxis protein